MKSVISTIISFFLLFAATNAFAPAPTNLGKVAVSSRENVSLNMVFGNKKKSAAAKAEEEAKAAMYWQGEWVCKDCGYIYNRVRFHASVCRSRIIYETYVLDWRNDI